MKTKNSKQEALRIAHFWIHGLIGFGYLLATALSLGALYQTGFGSDFVAGTYHLLTTTLPQVAAPCALTLVPGLLGFAANRPESALGRVAWAFDALLAASLAGAALGYASIAAGAAALLFAAASAIGHRCWPGETEKSVETGLEAPKEELK